MAQARLRNEETQASREAGDPEAAARLAAKVREARRRERLARHRAGALRAGEARPQPTRAETADLVMAERLDVLAAVVGWVAPRGRGAARVRDEACRLRLAVETALAARADGMRADLRLVETVELEAGREDFGAGDVVAQRRGEAQKRIRTRDGLKLLHERGGLTPKGPDGRRREDAAARIEADRLLAVGLRYRDLYELAAASLKSGLNLDGGRRDVGTLWAQAKAAQRRAALANQVRRLDVAVSASVGSEGLTALRMVAGEARTVRSLQPSRRPRDRLERALVRALHVVGDALGNGA